MCLSIAHAADTRARAATFQTMDSPLFTMRTRQLARVRDLHARGLASDEVLARHEALETGLALTPIDLHSAIAAGPVIEAPAEAASLAMHPLMPPQTASDAWDLDQLQAQPLAPMSLPWRAAFMASFCALVVVASASTALAWGVRSDYAQLDDLIASSRHWRLAGASLAAQALLGAIAATVAAGPTAWIVSRASWLRLGYGPAWLAIWATCLAAGMLAGALGLAAVPLIVPLALWLALWVRDQSHEVAVKGRNLHWHLLAACIVAFAGAVLLGSSDRVGAGQAAVPTAAPRTRAIVAPLDSLNYDMIAVVIGATSRQVEPGNDAERQLLGESVGAVASASRYEIGKNETALELDFDSELAAQRAMAKLSTFRDPTPQTRSGVDESVAASVGSGFDDDWTTQVTTIARSGRRIVAFVFIARSPKAESAQMVKQGQSQQALLLDAFSEQTA
jgi:hypothetical protein